MSLFLRNTLSALLLAGASTIAHAADLTTDEQNSVMYWGSSLPSR